MQVVARNGYELVQQIRNDPDLRATRVIFFSAVYSERETQAMAQRCGAMLLPEGKRKKIIGLKEVEAEGGLKLLVASSGGEFYGYQAQCPHQDVALCEGLYDGAVFYRVVRDGNDRGTPPFMPEIAMRLPSGDHAGPPRQLAEHRRAIGGELQTAAGHRLGVEDRGQPDGGAAGVVGGAVSPFFMNTTVT